MSLGTRGTAVSVESVGTWETGDRWATAVRAGRMDAEEMWGHAPPKKLLCSEDPLAPAACRSTSAHLSVSRYIRDQLGRSP